MPNGTNGPDTLIGNDNNENFEGFDGQDYIDGAGGDDIIQGGGGADELHGGAGNDRLYDNGAGNWLDGGEGSDRLIYLTSAAATAGARFTGGAGFDRLIMDSGSVVDLRLATIDTDIETFDGTVILTPQQLVQLLQFTSAYSSEFRLAVGAVLDLTGSIQGTTLRLANASTTVTTANFEYKIYGGTADDAFNGGGNRQDFWGGGGDDTLNGGAGNDWLHGEAGKDLIDGGDGDDTLYGDDGNDTLLGGAGNDRIYEDNSFLRIDGGADDDKVYLTRGLVLSSGTELTGGSGFDTLYTAAVQLNQSVDISAATLSGFEALDGPLWSMTAAQLGSFTTVSNASITIDGPGVADLSAATSVGALTIRLHGSSTLILPGVAGNALVLAQNGNDTIRTGGGADTIDGLGGNDLLDGGGGDDILDGGTGTNQMHGGTGNDVFRVTSATDQLFEDAGAGTDTVQAFVNLTLAANIEKLLLGGSGNLSGTGNELANDMRGNGGDNQLSGAAGNDTLFGFEGSDTLDGGEDDDQLNGGGGDDALNGGSGKDMLDGAVGADLMAGGSGDDIYYIDSAGDTITENANEGEDSLFTAVSFALGTLGVSIPTLSIEHLTLTGGANNSLAGNELTNHLVGNTGNNVLEGYDGNDRLEGGDGNDNLQGGRGVDVLIGGKGDDVYYTDTGGDSFVELANEGTDTLRTYLYQTGLAENLENLVGLSAIGQRLTGNDVANRVRGFTGDDVLVGGGGDDTLEGGAGNDRMRGGLGNDTYFVDDAGDQVEEANGAGADRVIASISFALGEHVETLQLVAGAAALDGTGNVQDNKLVGNDGANILKGLGGADALLGGGGADSLYGGAGLDKLTGGAGADNFHFDAAPVVGQADVIDDFSVADDTIRLDRAVFTAVNAGALDASAFRIGTAALDADDRIVYDSATGKLWYDADGSGAGAAVQFAQLSAGLALTSADFLGY